MAKKRTARAVESKPVSVETPWRERVEAFIQRYSVILFLAMTAIATARIVATYNVFNHTIDEPAHIACGMEWLDKKTYKYETQHPPFARAMTAILPYLDGAHSWGRPEKYNEGAAILYTGNNYDRELALARAGILPFFWLASLVVWLWARRSFGETEAFFATLCFTFLPSALAHGGLATTDMALTATIGAAFLTMLMWIEKPTWQRSALFGLALASSILSKFSVFAFFPSACLVAIACYFAFLKPSFGEAINELKTRLLPLGIAALVCMFVIWAGYRFSFAKYPAPELFEGIQDVINHNKQGHPSYILGNYSETGFWYYYPVILMFKTPLPVLALFGLGVWICWKRRREGSGYWAPLAFVAGILGFSLFSHINIGVRHVLPVYLVFSMVAGLAARWLWNAGSTQRWILAGLTAWMLVTSVLSHPDYLPYFNAFAGDEPEKIAIDSDLDWGQDMKRLSARLKEVGATQVAFEPFIIAHLEAVHGFPPIKPLEFEGPVPGWNAASITLLKIGRLGLDRTHLDQRIWTDIIPPTERVGKGVLLWYAPPRR